MTRSKQSLYEKSRSRFVALLFGGDLVVVVLSLVAGYYLRFDALSGYFLDEAYPQIENYWVHACLGVLVYVVAAHAQHLYRWSVVLSRARTSSIIVKVTLIWALSTIGLALLLGIEPPVSRLYILCSSVVMIVLLPVWRLFMHAVLHRTNVFERCYRGMAVVGTGEDAQAFAAVLDRGSRDLFRFVGYVKTQNHRDSDEGAILGMTLGSSEGIESVLASGMVGCLTVADVDLPRSQLVEIAKQCENHYVDFKAMPKSFEVFSSCLEVTRVAGFSVMSLTEMPQNRSLNSMLKRSIDVVGSLVGLGISLPIFAVLIPLIKRESPGPVFYRQTRVGQGGAEFSILKLRSMRVDSEASGSPGWSTKDDPRRTAIGTFMRKWNLDEIPQFWNVLKGEMSLVGPRPERPELISEFLKEIPYYQSRHCVKPGMTGWAQVNGLRGDTSIAERIRYDLQYIEDWSIWKDLTIQFKTFFNYKGAC